MERARGHSERHRVQPIPDVTGRVGVGQDLASDGTFANVGLSLPVPLHYRNQGNLPRARTDYCRAVQEAERLRRDLADRLAMSVREFEQAVESARLYSKEIIPKTDRAQELAEEGYVAGEIDFLRLLTARRDALEANLRYVASLADAAKQRAFLDGALLSGGYIEGVEFPRDDALRGLSLNGQ